MPLLLADASPVVGFAAASQHDVLWRVVQSRCGEIVVDYQIDREVTRVARATSRKALSNYDWMKRQRQVRVLPEVTPFGTDADVFNTAANLLDADIRRSGAPQNRLVAFDELTKDLGEALTVGHARKLRRARTDAEILIDDGGGIAWADRFQIPHVGTLWILEQAITDQDITDRARLTEVYTAISKHARLPRLRDTPLLGMLPSEPG
jgi:hypothetical protein